MCYVNSTITSTTPRHTQATSSTPRTVSYCIATCYFDLYVFFFFLLLPCSSYCYQIRFSFWFLALYKFIYLLTTYLLLLTAKWVILRHSVVVGSTVVQRQIDCMLLVDGSSRCALSSECVVQSGWIQRWESDDSSQLGDRLWTDVDVVIDSDWTQPVNHGRSTRQTCRILHHWPSAPLHSTTLTEYKRPAGPVAYIHCVSKKFTILVFTITKSDVDQFLPRDAAQSAVMTQYIVRLFVCPSVRLSVCNV